MIDPFQKKHTHTTFLCGEAFGCLPHHPHRNSSAFFQVKAFTPPWQLRQQVERSIPCRAGWNSFESIPTKKGWCLLFFSWTLFWTGSCLFFWVFFLGGNDERNMSFVELNCVHTSPFNEPRDLNKKNWSFDLDLCGEDHLHRQRKQFSPGFGDYPSCPPIKIHCS